MAAWELRMENILYEEAAKMYEAAFQICEEESMRRAYLYCCKNL